MLTSARIPSGKRNLEGRLTRRRRGTDKSAMTTSTDPFALFADWFQSAEAKELNDPNGVALATVDATGMPNARMVLLKGVDPRGFVFYTNLESA